MITENMGWSQAVLAALLDLGAATLVAWALTAFARRRKRNRWTR